MARSFVAAVRVEFLRLCGRPCGVPTSVWSSGDSFSSLCAAFTLCT